MSGAVPLNPIVDFIAGTVGGTASLIVGFPFDTVKVRFQDPANAQRYSGSTIRALAQIAREEKFVGLFRGITSPLASVSLLNGLVFASYGFFMKMQLPHADALPTLTQVGLAGMGSGIVSSLITTPTELLKIQQQTHQTGSATSLARAIFKEAGVRGLYRGLPATALRDIGYGAYFFAYEATIRMMSPPTTHASLTDHSSLLAEADADLVRGPLSWPALILAGGVAGIAGWLFTFPMDVVKTRMQARAFDFQEASAGEPRHHAVTPTAHSHGAHRGADLLFHSSERQSLLGHVHARTASTSRVAPPPPSSVSSSPNLTHPGSSPPLRSASQAAHLHPYRSVLSTIVHSYRTEGAGVFFRGLGPTLIRAIPVNIVTFATFEAVVHGFERFS